MNDDHNFQMFHILYFIKIRIYYASIDVHKFINSLKCSYISIHNGHGLGCQQCKVDNSYSLSPKKRKTINMFECIESRNIFNLMINMRIFFNFIPMMLINHIFNIHSNIFLK
jgi:hypothetical protein